MNIALVRQSACAVVAAAFVGVAAAQTLEPFQQQALERILASMDPALRPMMRAQLEPTLAVLNPEQIELMLTAMTGDADAAPVDDAPAQDEPEDAVASAEDLAYNRAQYEPMIREAWQAAKAYDDFVAAQLDEHCGQRREFAVFGSAWRYEVYPLAPNWPKASNDPNLDVQIIGGSYAPQDGRYDFDFSAVRLDFDTAAVERAVADACAEYIAIGEAFVADARADVVPGDDVPPNGMQLESSANGKASLVRARLEQVLESQAPGGNNALLMALLNGERVN